MKTLGIKAPINSFVSAMMQIESGATELYVGLDRSHDDRKTFTARADHAQSGRKTVVDETELAKIVRAAHARQVRVSLAANVPQLGTDPDGSATTRGQYLAYVRRGVEAGVDSVIVGDLGNLLYLRKQGLTIPLEASVHLATLNRFHLQLYGDLGVDTVVLPHHVTMDEIRSLAGASRLKVIVFGHFGCSFLECTCSLYHDFSERVKVGVPCRALWYLPQRKAHIPITNVAEDCSICVLGELQQAGVHAVKIIGRELDPQLVAGTTAIYADAIKRFAAGDSKDAVLASLVANHPWWEKRYCQVRKCKYFLNSGFYV